jgi:hypothetical protein
VLVNVSNLGCDAIILPANPCKQPIRVELPGVFAASLSQQARRLELLTSRSRAPGVPFLQRERDRHEMFDILERLWTTITEPVIAVAVGDASADDASLPRLWWIPTGPLTLLPLHAAGCYPRHLPYMATAAPTAERALDRAPDSVPARVVSSYATTLAALGGVQPAEPVPVDMLLVGVPTTPMLSDGDLDWGALEVSVVRQHLPDALTLASVLTAASNADGTSDPPDGLPLRERVLAALPEHSWLHLVCHARQDYEDPLRSGFILWDGLLTLEDLSQLPSAARDLAFLSACETAAGTQPTADEALHLAGAMTMLGYRHVVATSWSVLDQASPTVADHFYARLSSSGGPSLSSRRAARALHEAVDELRRAYPTDPFVWAPFSHFGP